MCNLTRRRTMPKQTNEKKELMTTKNHVLSIDDDVMTMMPHLLVSSKIPIKCVGLPSNGHSRVIHIPFSLVSCIKNYEFEIVFRTDLMNF